MPKLTFARYLPDILTLSSTNQLSIFHTSQKIYNFISLLSCSTEQEENQKHELLILINELKNSTAKGRYLKAAKTSSEVFRFRSPKEHKEHKETNHATT